MSSKELGKQVADLIRAQNETKTTNMNIPFLVDGLKPLSSKELQKQVADPIQAQNETKTTTITTAVPFLVDGLKPLSQLNFDALGVGCLVVYILPCSINEVRW